MGFEGWNSVARKLQARASQAEDQLNAGQRDSLRAIATRIPMHGVILADEVGMGKTRIAVALSRAVVEAGGRVAILVPPTLGFQWQEELRRGGIPDVPELARGVWGYLKEWEDPDAPRPWFGQPVVLISHAFTNWRLGETTQRWRYDLLPMLAGHAAQRIDGTAPFGFKTAWASADWWVKAATISIVDDCAVEAAEAALKRFETLGRDTHWRRAHDGLDYNHGGANRHLLQQAIGLGFGAFDLVVIDEAHKSRGGESGLTRLLENTLLPNTSCRRIGMTATPVELDATQWRQALERIGVDVGVRAAAGTAIDQYRAAVQRVRLAWKSSEDARLGYISAARSFEAILKPFVLRRDKRSDDSVALYGSLSITGDMGNEGPPGGSGHAEYRWEQSISVDPCGLEIGWRRAVCAAEALSFVTRGHGDYAAQRLRLTFGNGHGVATRLDQFNTEATDVVAVQSHPNTDDADNLPLSAAASGARPSVEVLAAGDLSHDPGKRATRASWWKNVMEQVCNAPGALYDHPAIRAAIAAIENYQERGEKVLVFGRFTAPMQHLVDLLNARAMLRALDAGQPWPQEKISKEQWAAVRAASAQLNRSGPFDPDAIDRALASQYALIRRRREKLRETLFEHIEAGLPAAEREALSLAAAAKAAGDGAHAVLAAAIDQLLEGPRSPIGSQSSSLPPPQAIAEAFLALLSALRERGEGDHSGDGQLDESEAQELWTTISGRLQEEYVVERGRFARLMNGTSEMATRRALQLAFNRRESNPRVLVAQSVVGREGLNLHTACRVVVLLHPEWNPGVVEQQIGRVDRVGSRWAQLVKNAEKSGERPLPQIEVRPVVFEGTYDAHHWKVLHERWDDLRAQLHGVVVPYRLRVGSSEREWTEIRRLDAAAPDFRPASAVPMMTNTDI